MQPATTSNPATPTTTRRGFLGHVAGAYLAAGALTTNTAIPDDPLADMIAAYRRELKWVNDLPGDPPDDFVWRAMNALDAEVIPVPATRETALDALRVAQAECRDMSAPAMVLSLITASLAYFEATS